ncbi:hypothetical protein ATR1_032c0001, partial [Acetobacter tropicalis]
LMIGQRTSPTRQASLLPVYLLQMSPL